MNRLIFGLALLGLWFYNRKVNAAEPFPISAPRPVPLLNPTLAPRLNPATPISTFPIPTITPQVSIMPRGIRNHNPMNLRYYASIPWEGQIGDDGAGYARFETVEYGIRAGVKNLLNGYFARGIDTPVTIISRYAPSHENPTEGYIDFVARQMGIYPTTRIEPTRENLLRLTRAIIHFENGSNPYHDATILRGIDLAIA